MLYRISFLLLIIVTFSGCGLQQKPIETIADVKQHFQNKIEDITSAIYAGKNYKSIAFGETKVYRPDAFRKLDSVYKIKQKYIQNNDLRGLRNSGIEDVIPGYRAAASQVLDSVKYEIEHVYQTSKVDTISIHHSFYLFNYKDSLELITPFYTYDIPSKLYPFFDDYIYRKHFITDRNLYISSEEVNFINYFNQHKTELIGTEKLQPFMIHLFKLMRFAHEAHSVDFNELSKYVALHYLKDQYKDIIITDLGKLYAYKEDQKVLNYELKITWTHKNDNNTQSTTFTYSPYLELEKVKLTTLPKEK